MAEYVEGRTVRCETINCPSEYHVTCAHRNGIQFRDNEWPEMITSSCEVCHQIQRKLIEEPVKEDKRLEINECVIAKHKNRRYYNAIVVQRSEEQLHTIYFPKINEIHRYVTDDEMEVSNIFIFLMNLC